MADEPRLDGRDGADAARRGRAERWRERLGEPLSLRSFLVSQLAGVLLVLVIAWVAVPVFESVDDVHMSMRAHGYGSSETASANLIFSTTTWGNIVRAIPEVGGYLGYSIATMAVIALVAGVLLYVMRGIGAGWVVAAPLVVLVVSRAVVYPQFTINAGLLAVAAMATIVAWSRSRSPWLLALAVGLGLLSVSVRTNMFFLVAAVALPLLPWGAILRSRAAWASIVAFGVLAGGILALDARAYDTPGWNAYEEINDARRPFTDYGLAGDVADEEPEVAERHGLSVNDMDLLGAWFYPDTEIWSPERLDAIRAEADAGATFSRGLGEAVDAAVRPLTASVLAPIVAAAIGLLVLVPGRRQALAWGLFAAAMVAFAVAGRPGVERVYLPLLGLLALAPLLAGAQARGAGGVRRLAVALRERRQAVGAVLVMGVALQAAALVDEQRTSSFESASNRAGLSMLAGTELAERPLVTWGADLAYQTAFPVLARRGERHDLRFYALGTPTHAPSSVAFHETQEGRNLLDLMRSPEGAVFVMTTPFTDGDHQRLSRFCAEHFDASYRNATSFLSEGLLRARTVRCDESVPPILTSEPNAAVAARLPGNPTILLVEPGSELDMADEVDERAEELEDADDRTGGSTT